MSTTTTVVPPTAPAVLMAQRIHEGYSTIYEDVESAATVIRNWLDEMPPIPASMAIPVPDPAHHLTMVDLLSDLVDLIDDTQEDHKEFAAWLKKTPFKPGAEGYIVFAARNLLNGKVLVY